MDIFISILRYVYSKMDFQTQQLFILLFQFFSLHPYCKILTFKILVSEFLKLSPR